MILVIDNFDSFVHNLARHIRLVGRETQVVRNDEISVAEISQLDPEAIVLSPGPCRPEDSSLCIDIVTSFLSDKPILGICLGHQAIVQALGGRIVHGRRPVHGQSSLIWHTDSKLFAGTPSPFQVGRYHSLVADQATLPDSLEMTATTRSGTPMAVEHREFPVFGLQFHPESILTESGLVLLENFCKFIPQKISVDSQ